MIPLPHGGRLIERTLRPYDAERRRAELRDLPKLWPESDQLLDAEKIGVGAYSPLDGFMGREALDGVLEHSRLPNSLAWTIPIVLTPRGNRNRTTVEALLPGDEVALMDTVDRFVALLHLTEKFAFDKRTTALATYGTTDVGHPNVAELSRTGETGLAGPIEIVTHRELPTGAFEMTPAETRDGFRKRHWNTVAAYQTRNVPHRAHEYLQRITLEREEIDGLFIHPVTGPLKRGDYRPEVVLSAYELLIRQFYPAHRVLLATLTIAMRYAGPRAAIFLAIIRKNFGCSHYIIGRDQAGIGNFYAPFDSQRIFNDLPVGVVPLRYPEAFYCRSCASIATPKTCPHPENVRESTSQTRIRRAIREGKPIPPEILRPEIASLLERFGDPLNDGPEPPSRDAAERLEPHEAPSRVPAKPLAASSLPNA
jgi:sulfate adenylyltransferase